jgi:trimeric autotransporter adhesin
LAQIIEALNREKSLSLFNTISSSNSSSSSGSSSKDASQLSSLHSHSHPLGSYAPPFALGVRLAPKSNPLVIGDHVIAHVDTESLADKAGVRVMSKIVQLNDTDCTDKTHEFTLFYLNYLLRKNSCQSIDMTLAEPSLSITLPSIITSNISTSSNVSTAANHEREEKVAEKLSSSSDLSNLKSIIDEILLNASAIVHKQSIETTKLPPMPPPMPETECDETTATTMMNLNTSNDNSFSELNSSSLFTTTANTNTNANNVLMTEQEQVNEYLKRIFFEASKTHHQHEPQIIKLPYIEPESTTTKDELSLTSSNLVFNNDDDLANLRDIIKEIRSNASSPVSSSSLDQTQTNQVNTNTTTIGGGVGGGGITITDATSTFGQYMIVNDNNDFSSPISLISSSSSSSSTLTTTLNHQNDQTHTSTAQAATTTTTTEPHHIIIQVTNNSNSKDTSSSLLTNPPPVPTQNTSTTTTNQQFESSSSSSSNEYYATLTSTYERESRGDNQLYEVELLESNVDFETKGIN